MERQGLTCEDGATRSISQRGAPADCRPTQERRAYRYIRTESYFQRLGEPYLFCSDVYGMLKSAQQVKAESGEYSGAAGELMKTEPDEDNYDDEDEDEDEDMEEVS